MSRGKKKTPIGETLEELRCLLNIPEERHKELVEQATHACENEPLPKIVVMSAEYQRNNLDKNFKDRDVEMITCHDDDGNSYMIFSDDENMLDAEIGKVVGVTNREYFLCELSELQERLARERGIPFVWKPPPEGEY